MPIILHKWRQSFTVCGDPCGVLKLGHIRLLSIPQLAGENLLPFVAMRRKVVVFNVTKFEEVKLRRKFGRIYFPDLKSPNKFIDNPDNDKCGYLKTVAADVSKSGQMLN